MQTPARDTHRLAQHARPRLRACLKDRLAQATLGGDPQSKHQVFAVGPLLVAHDAWHIAVLFKKQIIVTISGLTKPNQ